LIPDIAGVMAALDLHRAEPGLEPRVAPASAPAKRGPSPEAPPRWISLAARGCPQAAFSTALLKRTGAYEQAFEDFRKTMTSAHPGFGGHEFGIAGAPHPAGNLTEGGGDDLQVLARAEAMKLFHEEPVQILFTGKPGSARTFDSDLAVQMQKAKYVFITNSL